jgi:iron complex transport system substrate-binding protein
VAGLAVERVAPLHLAPPAVYRRAPARVEAGDPAATAASPNATSHTVLTVEGPVTVPSSPQRIVAIQPFALATLLDVGDASEVVGTYDEGASYVSPRYLATYNKVTKVGNEGQLNLEEIAALKPDLIIGANYTWNTQD